MVYDSKASLLHDKSGFIVSLKSAASLSASRNHRVCPPASKARAPSMIKLFLNKCPASDLCSLHHAEQVARIIGISDHVELDKMPGGLELVVHIAQRGKILRGETDTVKQGDLVA